MPQNDNLVTVDTLSGGKLHVRTSCVMAVEQVGAGTGDDAISKLHLTAGDPIQVPWKSAKTILDVLRSSRTS